MDKSYSEDADTMTAKVARLKEKARRAEGDMAKTVAREMEERGLSWNYLGIKTRDRTQWRAMV